MKKKILLLLSIVLVTSLFACKKNEEKQPVKAAEKAIVIGVQGPETGNIAVYGLQTLAGAQLAADEINKAGGVNGMPIKIIHYDSRGDKTEAANVTQRLVTNDKVCAIIGEPTSGALFALRNIADNAKTIAISAGATAQGVTDGKPFIFRNTLLDSDGAPATLKFLMDTKGWKNYALITSKNNDYSVGLSDTYKNAIKTVGANLVAEQTISDGDTDVSAQITSLKNKQLDGIIFTGYYAEASMILLEMRKQGMTIPLIGGDGYQSPELYNVAKDAALGTIFFTGFSTMSKDPRIVEFNNKISNFNATSDIFSAQGYDAMYLLAAAAAKAGVINCEDATQRTAMRDALAATKDFSGVSGTMSFDAEGSAVKKPFIQEVAKDEKGAYYFKLLNE